MALVRVYCGLASADESVRSASAAPLTIAVVDDAGRLLGVHEISDDPGGYAQLGTLLVERTTGFSDAAVAADSDDHIVTSLLTAAGRPLVVVDDDDADDFAERFSDDDSPEEIAAPTAARRAVGLARALQAGAIAAINLPTPRELVSYKPVLAAHVAMLVGRNSTAGALREVLRELYPAALRAYPDPAHPLALAVLDAVPEPGRLTGRGGDPEQTAREIAVELSRAGAGTEDQVFAAVTALHVAISESPRRGGVNKSLAPAAADAVRQSIAAVLSCDAACAALVSTLSARVTPPVAGSNVGRRAARRSTTEPTPAEPGRCGRRGRPEPAGIGRPEPAGIGRPEPAGIGRPEPTLGRREPAGIGRLEPTTIGNGPATPRPMTAPPAAPDPIGPPPMAPAAANGLPSRPVSPGNRPVSPGNRPVSVPPPPPGMTPITPGSRPVSGTRSPAAAPSSAQPGGRSSPADAGEPFRPTLANAELNRARAERQRTVIPPRPATTTARQTPAANGAPSGPTDFSLPVSAQSLPGSSSTPPSRPAQEIAEPGSRANWPLLNSGKDDAPASPSLSSPSSAPSSSLPSSSPALPERLPLAERSGLPERSPLSERTGLSERSGLPERSPLSERTGLPERSPLSERTGLPERTARPERPAAASVSSPPPIGRVKPPWQDMPKEPPALRMGDQGLNGRGSGPTDTPSLRLIEGETRRPIASGSNSSKLTALDRSSTPPVPADGNDGDLLIFAAARSAWFTGHDATENLNWSNPNDSGWRAAEKAATPAVAAETSAGLPKRVPQANLVPGSSLSEERPLRIVRDAASIAAHTTGYFRGWRRGQEIGGFAMGGRPGREAAGGWDFTRDGQPADEYRDNSAGFGGR